MRRRSSSRPLIALAGLLMIALPAQASPLSYVTAALSAVAALRTTGMLAPYLSGPDAHDQADRLAFLWRRQVASLFQVHVDPAAARMAVQRFATTAGVGAEPGLASVPATGLDFEALSLDRSGHPVPVLDTDVGFELLFGAPTPEAAARIVDNVMRPFPAAQACGAAPSHADALAQALGAQARPRHARA